MASMNRADALEVLKRNRDELRARGVVHAALFGSVARGDETPDSDVDIVIDLDPNLALDIFQYVGLKNYIQDLFPNPVDVVDRDTLKPLVRSGVINDSIYAF
jgi:predicted nucleotidyltransferase